MMHAAKCPLCDGEKFDDFNGRSMARCSRCGSFERTRLCWLLIESLTAGRSDLSVSHFAPERSMATRLHALGGQYRAFDFSPDRFGFKGIVVEPVDLCSARLPVADGTQDVIVHNHVMEHVRCNVWSVLRKLDRLTAARGIHIFSLPIVSGYYREDLDPAMSPEERVKRFGQDDHVRAFGRADSRKMLEELFGRDVHFSALASFDKSTLRGAAIPESVSEGVSSHTVFVHQRPVSISA